MTQINHRKITLSIFIVNLFFFGLFYSKDIYSIFSGEPILIALTLFLLGIIASIYFLIYKNVDVNAIAEFDGIQASIKERYGVKKATESITKNAFISSGRGIGIVKFFSVNLVFGFARVFHLNGEVKLSSEGIFLNIILSDQDIFIPYEKIKKVQVAIEKSNIKIIQISAQVYEDIYFCFEEELSTEKFLKNKNIANLRA